MPRTLCYLQVDKWSATQFISEVRKALGYHINQLFWNGLSGARPKFIRSRDARDAQANRLSLNTEIERLQRAINDHVKAARGSGLKFRLVDFDANLNLAPAVTAAGVAYAAGLSIPLSLLTGLGTALSLKIGPSLKRHEATSTPFKYVSSYHRELF